MAAPPPASNAPALPGLTAERAGCSRLPPPGRPPRAPSHTKELTSCLLGTAEAGRQVCSHLSDLPSPPPKTIPQPGTREGVPSYQWGSAPQHAHLGSAPAALPGSSMTAHLLLWPSFLPNSWPRFQKGNPDSPCPGRRAFTSLFPGFSLTFSPLLVSFGPHHSPSSPTTNVWALLKARGTMTPASTGPSSATSPPPSLLGPPLPAPPTLSFAAQPASKPLAQI